MAVSQAAKHISETIKMWTAQDTVKPAIHILMKIHGTHIGNIWKMSLGIPMNIKNSKRLD